MNIDRRSAIAGSAAALAGVSAPVTVKAEVDDPLIEAIRKHDVALDHCNNVLDDYEADDYYSEVVHPLHMRLRNWSEPARTRAGALEAIRCITRIVYLDGIDEELAHSMTAAALAYFEAEGTS